MSATTSPRRPPWIGFESVAWTIVFLASTHAPALGDDSPATLCGVVVDEAGRPVAGATVEPTSYRDLAPVRTDTAGRFTITDQNQFASVAALNIVVRVEGGYGRVSIIHDRLA